MKSQKTLLALAFIASAAVTGTAQASLVDRGNGLLYDNVLNVTWLQDANYAKTSGYSATDKMNWTTATAWSAQLNFDGLTGWRLATNTPINGRSFYIVTPAVNGGGPNGVTFNPAQLLDTYNGTSDDGYNITSPNSELAYMFNVNLGLKNLVNATGIHQLNVGTFGNVANLGLVHNLQSNAYWSGTGLVDGAWYFDTRTGYQSENYKTILQYAWAVRPGDVAAVPVPGAVWLFGSGLLGLLGLKKRKAA